MYPNLYFVFKDWFGVEWKFLSIFNSFGLFVAISFLICAYVLRLELKRKCKDGVLVPVEQTIIVGKPASIAELLTNFIMGFILGYKILGLLVSIKKLSITPQEYLFSSQGNVFLGILLGGVFAYFKWKEKDKQKLATPEKRVIRVWPYDRVGEITMLALIFGVIGAKIFDTFENWDDFIKDPASILSASGLTFYGGLICAGIALYIFCKKNKIGFIHFADIMGPIMILAYGLGRIGCQVSGDGDWGIFNSAYKTLADTPGVMAGTMQDFNTVVATHADYFAHHTTHNAFFAKPSWLGFLPDWFFAYDYPNNVNSNGIPLKDCVGLEYCNHLPAPVFPTPLYEIIMSLAIFGILWFLRKRIKFAGIIFGIYLIFNGFERFLIESIRVNNKMNFLGMQITQAQLISSSLMILGVLVIIYSYRKKVPTKQVI